MVLQYHTYVVSEGASVKHAVAFAYGPFLGREAGLPGNDEGSSEGDGNWEVSNQTISVKEGVEILGKKGRSRRRRQMVVLMKLILDIYC